MLSAGRLLYEETNKDLEGDKGYGTPTRPGVFDRMRRTDPRVRMSLALMKLPLLNGRPTIEPVSNDPLELEIADFVASNLFEDLPWLRINRESMLRYDYGFMLFEPLADMVDVSRARFPNLGSFGRKGRIGKDETVPAVRFTAFEPRLPRTLRKWIPREDRPTQLAGIEQWLATDDTNREGPYRYLPASHLLRFTHDQEGANFAGLSVLRSAYKSWRDLEHLERVEVIRHERQNVGIPVIECPENPDADELADMETTLEAIGSYEQGYLILPAGYKFRFDTSGEGQGTNVGASIAEKKRDILDNVLGGFLTLGNGDTGSYAMAETQSAYQVDYVDVGVKDTELVWNHGSDGWSPIRWLVDMNYGPQRRYPHLRLTNVKGKEYLATLRALGELVSKGIVTKTPEIERFVLGHFDLAPALDAGNDRRPDTEDGVDNAADPTAPVGNAGSPATAPMEAAS